MAAEPWRVAQLVTVSGWGNGSLRGSGYLVAPGLVLTCAHVVAGASVVRVRLDVGRHSEIEVQAERWWADPTERDGTDLAVVMIPATVTAGHHVEPVLFGRVRDCAAVLAAQVFGFPRFKQRSGVWDEQRFRDLEQVTAHVPVAANRCEGTVAVYLDDPVPASTDQGSSPWEGMAGAAVWVSDRIIGVVAEHHPGEGTGRLTARRIDSAYVKLPEPDLNQLAGWLGLAPAREELADVVPVPPDQLLRSAYLEQVRDVAPDALIDREAELAQWADFCAGPGAYSWWQAGPWAGKTALAAWFVTHPPAGVEIVSFFITGRMYGQANSDAFLEAMIEQLNALRPVEGKFPPTAGARAGTWLSLLAGVAAGAEEQGRRLIVVVDGLDEDEAGASPVRGRPSIASLLPRRPPPGVRFIVTSRPDPGLPDDVPAEHPLRAGVPRRLSASQIAEDLERRAQQELRDLLAGDETAVSVVGYIAGSGGGLSRDELSELTGAPMYKLDPVLRGVSGRSLETRTIAYPRAEAGPRPRVYLFGHETLRLTAEAQLGTELGRYRRLVHDWVASYASQGWPDTTPDFAKFGYLGLLMRTGDVARLSKTARDPRRHAYLLRATGSEYATVTEIASAQRLVADQDVPDLRALAELTVYRHAISIRSQHIPVGLPAAWARLGRFAHAENLARTIAEPGDQAEALTALVIALARSGELDRAENLAATISDQERPYDDDRWMDHRSKARAELAVMIAQSGDLERAIELANTITNEMSLAEAAAGLTRAAVQSGDLARTARLSEATEVLAHRVGYPYSEEIQAQLAVAAAQAGDIDRAAALVGDLIDEVDRSVPLNALVTAVAQTGDLDWAIAIARTEQDPLCRGRAVAELAAFVAKAGDLNLGETLARSAGGPDNRLEALTKLVGAAGGIGGPDWTARLAAEAEGLARDKDTQLGQEYALTNLAVAVARTGDLDRAEALAFSISGADPLARTRAMTSLAPAVAQAGRPGQAEAIARSITDPFSQAQALTDLACAVALAGDNERAARLSADAEALARTIIAPHDLTKTLATLTAAAGHAGDLDTASVLADMISDPSWRTYALTGLIGTAARTGTPAQATRLADDAEALIRTITPSDDQMKALTRLIAAALEAGDTARAVRLADEAQALAADADGEIDHSETLASLVTVFAKAGDLDHAEGLALTRSRPDGQADSRSGSAMKTPPRLARADREAFGALVTVAAAVGDLDRAERLAHIAPTTFSKEHALGELAAASASTGELDRAENLARTITHPYRRTMAFTRLMTTIGPAGERDRAARLAAEAEQAVRGVTSRNMRAFALPDLATALARSGDPDRARKVAAEAEELARDVSGSDSMDLAHELAGVATAIALTGDQTGALSITRTIAPWHLRAEALGKIADAVAETGDLESAAFYARAVPGSYGQAQVLIRLSSAAVESGDQDLAALLGAEAEDRALAVTDSHHQSEVVTRLATAVAQASDLSKAGRLLALAALIGGEQLRLDLWMNAVARFFPSAIRDARDVLLNAYR